MSWLIWVSVYPGTLSHTSQWQYDLWWDFEFHGYQLNPWKGWKLRLSIRVVALPYLFNRTITTSLDSKAQVSCPSWQCPVCIVTQRFCGELALSIILLDSAVSLSVTDFNLYSFTEINPNHEHNSFWWILRVLLMSYEIWGWSWEPYNSSRCQSEVLWTALYTLKHAYMLQRN